MLNNLSEDIIYIICQNLDLKDIYKLKTLDKYLFNTINSLSNILFIKELKKFKIKKNKNEISTFMVNFCRSILYNTVCNKDSSYYKRIYDITPNNKVNEMFRQALTHYIYNSNFENYNILNLLILYNFIQIYLFNRIEVDYYVNFIESLTNNHYNTYYDDIIIKYYTFLIKSLNLENSDLFLQETNYTRIPFLKLENLYKISKWIVTPHILKKLCSYKCLNLTKTKFLGCCDICFKNKTRQIVKIKYYNKYDDLICHNYKSIKNFLHKERMFYYDHGYDKNLPNSVLKFMKIEEINCVNKKIFLEYPRYEYRLSLEKYLGLLRKTQRFLVRKIFDN
jgi:hypothetical protein